MALKKIEEWAESGKLAEHGHLLSILFMWRRWNDPNHASDYVQSLIKDDKALIGFIKHFLSDIRSHGMSDYVERVSWRINLESVETFVELNEVDKRLRKILIITDLGEAFYSLPKKLISKGFPASCHYIETG